MKNSDIAQRIGVSEGTVRNRIQRMVQENILSFVGVLNPFLVSAYELALVGLKVDARRIDEVASVLIHMPEVRFLVACSGDFHLMMEVCAQTHEAMLTFFTDKLSRVDGIQEVQIAHELKLYKNSFHFFEEEQG